MKDEKKSTERRCDNRKGDPYVIKTRGRVKSPTRNRVPNALSHDGVVLYFKEAASMVITMYCNSLILQSLQFKRT
jgi:hypothetical protein